MKINVEVYKIYRLGTPKSPEGDVVQEFVEDFMWKSFPPQAPIGARISVLSADGKTYSAEFEDGYTSEIPG